MINRLISNRRVVLISIFSTAWCPVACEGFLRVLHPQSLLPRYVCATEFGIRGNKPSQNYVHSTPDVRVEMRINSQGIRADYEIAKEKPCGETRVVVLGDSFGMGYEVDIEDTFLTQSKQQLVTRGFKVEYVNLCVSGHGNAEEFLMLENLGLGYKPDIVLVLWHPSDLNENVFSNLYRLVDGELVRRAQEYVPAMKTRERLEQFRIYCWLEQYSHLYAFARESASRNLKSLMERWQGVGSVVVGAVERDLVLDRKAETSELQDRRKDLSVALLKKIKDLSEANGAKCLFLCIPTRFSRTQFSCDFPRDENGGTYGLDLIDPVPLFEEHEGELLFWERSHFHFTPLGCRLVADLLSDHLVTQGYVK